jgi:Tol biopolymer transport system component
MVTRDGFVKILDFGLAKLARRGFESSGGVDRSTVFRLTETGTVLGTIGYMSPEQASGEPADFRSDQFSLGSILYELASGKRAFDRPTAAQTLSAIIETEPEGLAASSSKVPTNLVWIVERCLAKDPQDRYESTRDLARDLAALRDHSSGISVSIEAPSPRRLRMTRAALAVAAAGVVAVATLAYFAGARAQERLDRDAPPPKRSTLTFRRGFVNGARFAPDGQTIVYSASWDGKPSEIFTTRVGSTDSRPLGISPASILAISSKGEMALSLDCAPHRQPCVGTLALAPLAGGAPRPISADVGSADWSPDGRELAATFRTILQYPIGKVLYQNDAFLSSVRVSPGGDLVAFVDHPALDSTWGILTVVDRAGRKKVLTREWARLGSLLWSPTGKEVFFSRWGSNEVRGASLDGRTRSTPWVLGLDDVSREGLFLDTGMYRENYRSVVRALVPGSSEERNLSWLAGSTVADISKDGKTLLLYEEGSNANRPDVEVFTTFLRPTDGSDAVRLGEGRALALSPDGKWALVARPSPRPHLVLLPTGLGQAQALPRGGEQIHVYRVATFFPDGRRILFNAHGDGGSRGLLSYIQDLDGGPPKRFDPGLMVVVSPDGRELAGWGEKAVAIFPADGNGPSRPIKAAGGDETYIQWSADGNAIFARDFDNQQLTIYRLDLKTGRRELWKELGPPDRTGFLFFGPAVLGTGTSITPDGRYYAYTYLTDSSRLVLGEAGPNWWK